jgi:hypothetical protein
MLEFAQKSSSSSPGRGGRRYRGRVRLYETFTAIHEVFGDQSRSEYRLVHRGRLGPMTDGWLIPPPSQPVKSDEDLRREREAKIEELERRGLLRAERLRRAMLTVRREDFVPSPTSPSFTATGDSGTPSTPPTTGSASRRPAPMSRRR